MKQPAQSILTRILVALAMILSITPGWAQTDASAKLKPMADAYAQAWNTGNVKDLDAIVDQNFVRHTSPALPFSATGLDSLKRVIARLRAWYPDLHVTLTEEIYTGDKIVVRWQYSGTHSGVGLAAAKGKHVDATGISLFHVKSGKLAEEWVETDGLLTDQQLGFTVMPPAEMKQK